MATKNGRAGNIYAHDRVSHAVTAVGFVLPVGTPAVWHLYTRPQNLVSQATPKVLFPMTIEDTVATVDYVGDIYQDNVNVNSITFPGAARAQLSSLAAVMNSSLFSALARLKAGLNDAGWRKLNRQYAELVPFPAAVLDDANTVRRLSGLAERITDLQHKAFGASSEGHRTGFRATLESLWEQLDDAVESVYGLSDVQRTIVRKYPRRVNRYDLLFRQTLVDEEE